MREIGAAAMPIIPTFDGLKASLEKGVSGPLARGGTDAGRRFGDNAGQSLTSSLSKHTKRAALLAAGVFAGAGIAAVKFGSDAVNLAADLEQSIGAVDTVFKGSADQMHAWAKSAATDVGLTRNEFNELGSLIGTQLRNGGTAMTKLAPKTRKLIALGADLSSMFGGDTREAVEALSSALKGERDPIERYGVSLTEASIKAEALSKGIIKAKVDSFDLKQATLKMTIAQANFNKQVKEHGRDSIEAAKAEATLGAATKKFNEVSGGKVDELTAQQKQMATLSLITKQTADAQGNFGKESDTLAHKQQVLKASLENIKTEIGTALLPIMSDAADFLLKKGVPAFQDFSNWFNKDGVPALEDFGREMRPLAESVIPAVGSALGTVADGLKAAAPLAKDLVDAFNDMPNWAKKGFVVGSAGLAVKSKLGKSGLFGGSKGGSLADPAYVWVVNGGNGPTKTTPGSGGGLKGAALTVAAAIGAQQFFEAQANSFSAAMGNIDTSSVDSLRAGLQKQIGSQADELNINIDRLAEEMFALGSNSEYVRDSMEKIEDVGNSGWLATSIDLVNGFDNDIMDARRSADDLLGAMIAIDKRVAAQRQMDTLKHLLGGDQIPGGAGPSTKVGYNLFDKIPDKKLKLLFDPETEKTRKGVREILGDVDGLTRRDFRLIFKALGLEKAKNDAQKLVDLIELATGMKVPTIGGASGLNPFDGGPVSRTANRSQRGVTVGNVTINATNADRLISELTDIQRRSAIGGY